MKNHRCQAIASGGDHEGVLRGRGKLFYKLCKNAEGPIKNCLGGVKLKASVNFVNKPKAKFADKLYNFWPELFVRVAKLLLMNCEESSAAGGTNTTSRVSQFFPFKTFTKGAAGPNNGPAHSPKEKKLSPGNVLKSQKYMCTFACQGNLYSILDNIVNCNSMEKEA